MSKIPVSIWVIVVNPHTEMGIYDYLNPHMETGNSRKYPFLYGDFCITRFHMGIIYLNPHMETGNNRKYPFPYGDFCITRFHMGIIYQNPHMETGKYVCQSPYGNCFHMATHMETDSRPFPYGDLCLHMGITYMVIFKNTAHSPVIHLLLKCIILEYDTHNIQVNGT